MIKSLKNVHVVAISLASIGICLSFIESPTGSLTNGDGTSATKILKKTSGELKQLALKQETHIKVLKTMVGNLHELAQSLSIPDAKFQTTVAPLYRGVNEAMSIIAGLVADTDAIETLLVYARLHDTEVERSQFATKADDSFFGVNREDFHAMMMRDLFGAVPGTDCICGQCNGPAEEEAQSEAATSASSFAEFLQNNLGVEIPAAGVNRNNKPIAELPPGLRELLNSIDPTGAAKIKLVRIDDGEFDKLFGKGSVPQH